MKKRNLTDMLIWIISAEIVGALSAIFSGGFSDFFEKYKEPPLLPPAWLFPVVWTILYALMGFSAYIISTTENPGKSKALAIYWTQLVINFSWSIVFFRFEALWASFAVIIVLLALIIYMVITFSKINKFAAQINIPYIVWVVFASYLNFVTALIN